MKKIYSVAIPFTGYIVTDVKAESEEEAIDLAFETDFHLKYTHVGEGWSDVEEFELHTEICTGNVLHASMNSVEIFNVEDS